jgi:hypothetical protein
VAVALAAGCDDPPPCHDRFIGDAHLQPEATPLVTDGTSGALTDIAAGDHLPLERPPQGGFVLYLGLRARNLDGCGVKLSGQLRDPDTNHELAFDARTIDLVPTADGWGVPDARQFANFANVPACPDYGTEDIRDRALTLSLTVTDKQKRSANATLPVVPSCTLADPDLQFQCTCECAANYSLGKCKPSDAGTDGG